jgi:hypothetical protein
LEFVDEGTLESLQLDLAAEFTTLSWHPDRGWKVANIDFGLPGRGAFGWRPPSMLRLARRLAQQIEQQTDTRMQNSQLLTYEPRIRFLSPASLVKLQETLASLDPPITLQRDEHGALDCIRKTVIVDETTLDNPSAEARA